MSGEDLIALIQNEKLPAALQPRPGNIIGKMLGKVLKSTGLTLRLAPPHVSAGDPRILVAGLTLLQVHDITGVRRQ